MSLQLRDISELTRARHLAWLAYNLMLQDHAGRAREAADEAAAAAASTGDLESRIISELTLALFDCGDGYADRAVFRLAALCELAHSSDVTEAYGLAAHHYALQLAVAGRVEDATAQIAEGTEHARREGNAMARNMWAIFGGLVHIAAGRLSAARAAVES